MSLHKYDVLLKIVETGSLTKAGEAMNLTQSAVSHAIASLERELGLNLIIRNRSGVRLTHDGHRLLPLLRNIVDTCGRLMPLKAWRRET